MTDELEESQARRYVLPHNVAKIYAVDGDSKKAFAWLDKAYAEGNPDLIELNSEPVFDGLRKDARFSNLMRELAGNLTWGQQLKPLRSGTISKSPFFPLVTRREKQAVTFFHFLSIQPDAPAAKPRPNRIA